jgi:hypothetical protein
MELNEAAALLQLNRGEVKIAIEEGIELPISKRNTKLKAHLIGNSYDIDDADLDTFIKEFELEEPGRNPPIAVRRELLIEAKHSCAICGEKLVLEFHHIIDFSSLQHYDTKHMMALCPTDHALCTKGLIDKASQYIYKEKLKTNVIGDPSFIYSIGPANFSWDELRQIITSLYDSVVNLKLSADSGFDFSEIDIARKNELNRVGNDYYNSVIVVHQPYFGRIQEFLRDPINSEIVQMYYQVVDEIRAKIAANRSENERFEYFLNLFADTAVKAQDNVRGRNRRTLNILLSFMYVNCDIGRKE